VQRNRPPSPQAINVLRALAADPARWRYGYDLATEVHLKSGSLYPILVRLADLEIHETYIAIIDLRSGHRVVTVDISEFEKLEGCVTCLSVRLRGMPGD